MLYGISYTGAKSLYSLALLSRRKEAVDVLMKTLPLIKRLNLSGCIISDKGTDLIVAIIHEAVSLEEFDVSYTNLSTVNCNKISKALKDISSLKYFRMNSSFITDESAFNLTAAVSINCFVQELQLSDNQISSVAMTQIIDALSKGDTIRMLDINNNCISMDKIKNLTAALANCYTLEVLNLSQNSLMFTGVLEIAQALRFHPSLKCLNLEKNVKTLRKMLYHIFQNVNF